MSSAGELQACQPYPLCARQIPVHMWRLRRQYPRTGKCSQSRPSMYIVSVVLTPFESCFVLMSRSMTPRVSTTCLNIDVHLRLVYVQDCLDAKCCLPPFRAVAGTRMISQRLGLLQHGQTQHNKLDNSTKQQ